MKLTVVLKLGFLFVFILKRELDLWKSLSLSLLHFPFLTAHNVTLRLFRLWVHYQYIKLDSFLHPQFLGLKTTLLATDLYV
jgi:hypothetical protein